MLVGANLIVEKIEANMAGRLVGVVPVRGSMIRSAVKLDREVCACFD